MCKPAVAIISSVLIDVVKVTSLKQELLSLSCGRRSLVNQEDFGAWVIEDDAKARVYGEFELFFYI